MHDRIRIISPKISIIGLFILSSRNSSLQQPRSYKMGVVWPPSGRGRKIFTRTTCTTINIMLSHPTFNIFLHLWKRTTKWTCILALLAIWLQWPTSLVCSLRLICSSGISLWKFSENWCPKKRWRWAINKRGWLYHTCFSFYNITPVC